MEVPVLLPKVFNHPFTYTYNSQKIKKLDQGDFNTRKDFFSDPKKLAHDFDMLDRYSLKSNTFLNWLKSIFFPDNTH